MANLTKIGIALGVGVADAFLEHMDNHPTAPAVPKVGWARKSNMLRAALVVGGYLADTFMPRYGALGETAALAATPLLVKTLATEFSITQLTQDFSPRDISGAVRTRNWVPADMGGGTGGGFTPPAGGGYRPIS